MGAQPGDAAEFTDLESAAMTAALNAAREGVRGANPLVGAAILTADGQIVTGHHGGAGTPHAEVDAITTAHDLDIDLTTSTLFVTLEPCAHHGRTGPCTEAIINAAIPSVVFAAPDPNPLAAGGGQTLAEAGLTVRSGLHEEDSRALNSRWVRSTAETRPFVSAKIAQSLDGAVAAADGTSQWITSAESRAHAHEVRSRVDAVLVGTGTAVADDPRLNARGPDGIALDDQPRPVVLGTSELPVTSFLALNPNTLQLRSPDVRSALDELYAAGVRHLLVEGGPTVLGAFFSAGIVDEVFCYQAPLLIGPGRSSVDGLDIGTLSEALQLIPDDTETQAVSRLGPDFLLHFTTADPEPVETGSPEPGT
ncbi:bifunctional diaminohydroxyphosphoribosylaminopyrimidine deaminase/5-amino-6-(5-phosphoribosylamino)uracil reductase RibD [Brevibacterium sp. JSBI002]|uniref:bifunctional diaminohydroxyphosphoribosylaminopyrimidine deaminase/5-amino-6-(5-phosphoribosylamino)uracil reductase RibD n=1 Tax=Brevibacterium sp. JSBI002 TaxID=2886045 RepID=UPI0022319708|nr:bifunctional diaminohydroxyphosphoribosylaminopyrimidine deaminase/5-amino-6-(5-phosphoribosylamino)uracil reductase RibD [Brevibacterium sp. JSBI002]UZD61956.1 bifunctional diaminohydroxyphosphoribosylaminopyrimidine deaminase/5-amino-6-(5-phosphoribosylamino)uracil reductase RibD [Brevibacterium sp. JSBI002]